MKIRGAFFALVAVTGSTIIPISGAITNSTPSSAAVAACGTFKNSYFDGLQADPANDSDIGSSASMNNQFAYFCTSVQTTNNQTSAWTMIQGSNNSICQYTQTGIITNATRIYYEDEFFAEYDNGNCQTGFVVVYGVTLSNFGEVHHYWDQFVPSCNCEYENVDVTTFQTTPFNPKNWTEPVRSTWSGEDTYLGSDMPGNPGEGYTSFTGLQVQQWNGAYTNTLPALGSLNDNVLRYTHTNVSGNAFTLGTWYEYGAPP